MAWIYVGPGGKRWAEEPKKEEKERKDSESQVDPGVERFTELPKVQPLAQQEGSEYLLKVSK